MKVLVILSFRTSFFTWKSVGNLNRELKFYDYLSKKYNINFSFFTYGDSYDKSILEEFDKNYEVVPLFDYFNPTKSKYKTFLLSLLLPYKIKNRFEEIDLLMCNQLTSSWVGFMFKLFLRKPVYLKTGYDAYTFSKYEKKTLFKKILFFILTQFSILFSNLYTVSSIHDAKFLQKRFFIGNRNKLLIRHNWVEYFELNDLDFSNRNLNAILGVGRLEQQKDFAFVISALKNSDLELHLVGSGSLEPELIELSKKNNVNLIISKNVDNQELLKVYQKYKFFVLPSNFEGNPKVLLESMAMGCVPVVSNIKNNTEIIKHNVNGYVFDKKDNNLIEFFSDNVNNEKIIENANKTISKSFSLEVISDLIYKDLISLSN